jgi:hypothetical protein
MSPQRRQPGTHICLMFMNRVSTLRRPIVQMAATEKRHNKQDDEKPDPKNNLENHSHSDAKDLVSFD